jgi:hypothetical protein
MSSYLYGYEFANLSSFGGATSVDDSFNSTVVLLEGVLPGGCMPEDDARMKWGMEIIGTCAGGVSALDAGSILGADYVIITLRDVTNNTTLHQRLGVSARPSIVWVDTYAGLPFPPVVAGPRWAVPTPTVDLRWQLWLNQTNHHAGTPWHNPTTWTINGINVAVVRQ